MRKIILTIVLLLSFTTVLLASDAQRQLSSGLKTSSASITTVPGTLYGLTLIAAGTNTGATIYDSSSSTTTGKKVLIEIVEATQYKTSHQKWEEGLKVYEGIYLEMHNSDAQAIVYYY